MKANTPRLRERRSNTCGKLPKFVRAVPMGQLVAQGFIDYRAFFAALAEIGYAGHVAYEMCSPLHWATSGGGGQENLDRCARAFVDYMRAWSAGRTSPQG